MTQTKKICATLLLALATAVPTFAGGILTNSNQSIDFLRNPARDGAIAIDGVYSNPAGVAFLGDGFHLGFNWQAAFQTRTVKTSNPWFADDSNVQHIGESGYNRTNTYKGNAKAPFLPSLHAAYVHKKWSFQFGFGIIGGGGKCEFSDGLGTFESAVASIGAGLQQMGAQGYKANYYMRGNQFYYGFTLGATYKPIKNLSVYVGARALYGTASYKASISNIQVNTANGMVDFGTFLDGIAANYNTLKENMPAITAGMAALKPAIEAGVATDEMKATYTDLATKSAQYQALTAAQPQLKQLEVYRNGVNLQCNQHGFGVAPIIGVDYKVGNFNFAAKYEFKTHMSLKNESTLKEAMAIEAVNQFKDGESVHEDMPAMLTVGAQWQIIPMVRVNAGYHHYYDKQAKKFNDRQDLLAHGTNEYLGGVEVEPVKKLTVSTGFQITRYGMTPEYMSDLTFVTNSWSFGVGAKYQFNKHIAAQVAYFQTNYSHYNATTAATASSPEIVNDYTRTNKVLGAGVVVDF